jgi:hypothetical protein
LKADHKTLVWIKKRFKKISPICLFSSKIIKTCSICRHTFHKNRTNVQIFAHLAEKCGFIGSVPPMVYLQ